ncbi:MAG TPA: PAS domain S-box protein [Pyrinomonadaceae bacterium]|jgi:PAS domain S-box-containing protein
MSRSTFETFFLRSASPMLIIGDGGFVDCNQAAVETLGFGDKSEVLALDLVALSPEFQPDGRSSAEKAGEVFAAALAAGNYRFDWLHRRADGRPLPVEVSLTAVEAGGGPALVAVWRDLTGHNEAEATPRTSDASYREIFDLSNEAIYLHDQDDGRIIDVNKKACEVHGYEPDEFKRLGIGALMTEPPYSEAEAVPLIQKAVGGEPQVFEWLSRDRRGRRFWMEVSLKRANIGGRERILSTARDITERKQAEEALRRAHEELRRAHEGLERRVRERTSELAAANEALQNEIGERRQAEAALQRAKEEAERANRAKSEFLSRMSHELRTPMNSILGFSQVLARKPLPPDQRKSVDHIQRAGRHLLNLINEVLDISRIEANRLQLSLEPVSVGQVVQEAINLTQPLAAQRDCEVRDDVGPDCDLYVFADRQRLVQVLLNLVSNALKYNSERSSVRLFCEAGRGEGSLRLGVSDDGVGIAPEKLPRLFSPFERLGAEQTGVEGTGLGLALSKGLIETMGGTMGVESRPGEGSTFWAELPVVESPRERLERSRDDVEALAGGLSVERPSTILYIEDNLANLSLIETILADREDIRLLSALQGRLGLDLAWEHRPDVILLDLHLPDIPGDEVLDRLLADRRTADIPVVVISADATAGHIQQVMARGARAYLTKPLDLDSFLKTLDDALNPPA